MKNKLDLKYIIILRTLHEYGLPDVKLIPN
jgi:hypothetical protein